MEPAFDGYAYLPYGVSFLVRIYDVVWEGVASMLPSGGLQVGGPVSHQFPRDRPVFHEVGRRVGEAAWMGGCDNMGLGLR